MATISIVEYAGDAAHNGWIRFGAVWTVVTSPYLLLAFAVIFLLGGAPVMSGEVQQALDIAGKSPTVFGTTVLLDSAFHVLFLVTAVTLFAVLRHRWPVRANLVLAFGAWQALVELTKGFSSMFMFLRVGSAYAVGDAAAKAALLSVASGDFGLRLALQDVGTFGVVAAWLVVSSLPRNSLIPSAVRWLGWVLTIGALSGVVTSGGPTFLIVPLLTPAWLFIVGRWILRHLASPEDAPTASPPLEP